MTKKVIFFSSLVACLLISSITVNAQIKTPAPSPSCKIEQSVGLTTITLDYSRPSKKGRTIFAADGLVPYGETWRTGANASTKIAFGDDVKVNGIAVPKGEYALYTVPNATEWDIIIYKNTSHWGVPREWNAADEAARFKVKAQTLPVTLETFTILTNNHTNTHADVEILWDQTYIVFGVDVEVDKYVEKDIEKAMAGTSRGDYYSAARYYFDNNKDLGQALTWIKEANHMDAKFWQLRLQSLIEAKMGDKASAIATARKSIEAAKAADNMDYVRLNEKSIAEWTGVKKAGSGSK